MTEDALAPPRPAAWRHAAPAFEALVVLLLLVALPIRFARALTYGHLNWPLTEMLIDYAGGFVRRGLLGQMLHGVAAATGWQANHLALAIAFGTYALVAAWFVRRSWGRLPLFVLASTLLFGAPVYADFIVRKDVLGIGLLIVCLWLLRRSWAAPVRFAAANLVACLAILMHEAFFFYACLPLMLVSFAELRAQGTVRAGAIALLRFLPAVAALLLVAAHKGDASMADAVNRSWLPLWRTIEPGRCCLDVPGGAIEALRWSASTGFSAGFSVLGQFASGLYVPLMWLITIALVWHVLMVFLPAAMRADLTRTMAIGLVCIVPLFVLGWDFGRWVFLWCASTLVLVLSGASRGLPLPEAAVSRFAAFAARHEAAARMVYRPLLVVLGIPAWHWTPNTFWLTSPLGFVVWVFTGFPTSHF